MNTFKIIVIIWGICVIVNFCIIIRTLKYSKKAKYCSKCGVEENYCECEKK